jgi:hypothetical protein
MYSQRILAVGVVAAVAAMLIATSAISVEDAFAGKKREYNQATSQTNACGNDFMSTNVGCQSTGSQVQGDENVVALTGQQTFDDGNGGNHGGHDGGHKRGPNGPWN